MLWGQRPAPVPRSRLGLRVRRPLLSSTTSPGSAAAPLSRSEPPLRYASFAGRKSTIHNDQSALPRCKTGKSSCGITYQRRLSHSQFYQQPQGNAQKRAPTFKPLEKKINICKYELMIRPKNISLISTILLAES
ncbi:mucin-1-like [Grus japonensis]|uniref:Mucin-1-like n=1 Tax=Grus japonensis TaxID=30415 RepID=A0ABC9X1X0_GRUJA